MARSYRSGASFSCEESQNGQIVHRCLACSSKADGIFCDLDLSSLRELDHLRQERVYPASTILFMEGDPPRAAYCVCSGRVKVSTVSSDGRAVVVATAVAGDVLGVRSVLLGRPHDLTAETTEETHVSYIPRDAFLGFLNRNGAVSLKLAQKLSNKLYDAYGHVRDAAFKQCSERLTELLLALCETHGEQTPDGIRLRTNLRQDELAEMVGVSRRSLTRALTELKRLGIIECGRRSILVRDSSALCNFLPSRRGF